MTKTRIEENEAGEFYTLIPEDIMADLMLDVGDVLEWEEFENGIVITTA